jgi:hypothetical protein
MVRLYEPRSRDKLIEQRNKNSLTHLLSFKSKLTLDEKRELILERNPYLFVFGEKLTPHNHYTLETYPDFINHEYLGEAL